MIGIKEKLTAAVLGLTLLGAPAFSQSIVVGAGQQGSQNYGINTGLAAVLSNNGFDVSLESYGGSGTILPLLNSGEIDVWAGGSSDVTEALNGSELFGGMKQENLSLAMRLFSTPIGLYVRMGSDIRTPEDMKGKTIPWGYTSQPSLQADVAAMLANMGLSIDDMKPVLVPSVGAGGDEFISGNVEVGMFAMRAGKMKEIAASVDGIRWLPFDNSEEAVARQKEIVITSDVMSLKAGDSSVGVEEDINVYAFNQVLVVRQDLPAETIAKIITTLYQNADMVREAQINADFDPSDIARDVTGLPWHPAALETFSELGLR